MKLLAVDPSSTHIGWAKFSAGRLESAGVLRPLRSRDSWLERLGAMLDELGHIVGEWGPNVAVVEVPSGTAAAGTTGRMGGYLAIYGAAVGAVWQDLRTSVPSHAVGGGRVETVTERDWTRSVPKERRARWLRGEYPQLAWHQDTGLDMADAIGIGLWWLQRDAFDQAVSGDLTRARRGGRR